MALNCDESFAVCRSLNDPVLTSNRVLINLLLIEQRYHLKKCYFKHIQRIIKPEMRSVLANWMFEVCELELCHEDIFPMAVTLIDRFLAKIEISKSQLQLLGSVCLILASKLRQNGILTNEILVFYSDFSINMRDLINWQLLVLSSLDWDISSITANDFLSILLAKIVDLIDGHDFLIRKHSQILIDLCYTEHRFSLVRASVIAASCIATAAFGLPSIQRDSTLQSLIIVELSEAINADKHQLLNNQCLIEEIIAQQVKTEM